MKAAVCVALSACVFAQDDQTLYVAGPASRSGQPAWLRSLKANRSSTLQRVGYTGGVFDVPELRWAQTAYVQTQMHPFDRFFYDPISGNYTVQRWLKDLQDRYGGIDALLLWPTYPVLGVDDRNQYDFFRAMPGGLEGIARVTQELEQSGVKVLWPYNPWDLGTRRELLSDEDTLASLLKQTGGRGINGDTMHNLPESFWTAGLKQDYPLVFQAEGGTIDTALNWTTAGWGQTWAYPEAPVVDRFKFLTSGQYMAPIVNRWMKSRVDMLQAAWFNGDGFESWENVWGCWDGIVPRDGEALRRVGTMLRFLGREGYLQSPDWEPHTLDVWMPKVYASKWPLNGSTLWTIVNRGDVDLEGGQLMVTGGKKYYDCYHGVELQAAPAPPLPPPNEPAVNTHTPPIGMQLRFPLEAHGYGCVLEMEQAAAASLVAFLATMREMTSRPLSSYSATWEYELQTMVEIPRTRAATEAPSGTVLVPKGGFAFSVSGVEFEGDDDFGVDVQYPWEPHPQMSHARNMTLGPFYMDKYPVTTTNYSSYLNATGYRPKDDYNWLKNWQGRSSPPSALADFPVTYLSLREAREYCRWKGARLPHSFEWQYAAQGTDGRAYPWGSQKTQKYYPQVQIGNVFLGPEPVQKHSPLGDSPFGVSDMVGNVWQYTDEFQDAHTRSVILRGGSNYQPGPVGSEYYFPRALELDRHEKYFLFDDRYERAGTVGFRCLVDAADEVLV